MLNKKCDYCKKDIEMKGKVDYQFSEWALFHHKKRRDFCSSKCFKNWIKEYFGTKIKFSAEELDESLHYINILSKNSSLYQPEIRRALEIAKDILKKLNNVPGEEITLEALFG